MPLLVATVLLFLGLTAQAQIHNGLVAYWNFESNYLDYLGEFDGTARGTAAIAFVDGKAGLGKAIKLDGSNQYVEITGGNEDQLEFPGGSMSIAGWFKVDAFDSDWQALIAKGEGNSYRVARRGGGNNIAYAGGAAEGPDNVPAVNDGLWHHFVAVSEATVGTRLYVDGAAYSVLPTPPALNQNSLNLLIGANPGAGDREWEGEIDDIALWGRVLTVDEINSLYAAGAGAPLSSLLGEGFLVVQRAFANAASVSLTVKDFGTSVADPATVTALLDTVNVSSSLSVSKVGSLTTIKYNILDDQNTFFESGSQHTLVVAVSDTQGQVVTSSQTFTVAPYATVPAHYALVSPATTPGLVVNRVFQTTARRFPGAAASTTATAEQQLAGGMIDQGTSDPLPNIAEDPGPINVGGDYDPSLSWTPYINWEQSAGNVSVDPPYADNFNSDEPPGTQGQIIGDYANAYPPGVLLSSVDPNNPADNFVMETVAYFNLKRGLHRWGVNSDDGFKVTFAPGQPTPLGTVVGEFSAGGGRGADDTVFDFVIQANGYYPVRLLYWEDGVGASCEWFSVDVDTGEKILIGDTLYYPDDAYQPFRNGQGRAHVRSITPAPGYTGASREPTIRIELANGRTSYVTGSARLFHNGEEVTPTIQGTVITYPLPTRLGYESQQSVQLIWQESTTPVTNWTNSWTFTSLAFSPEAMPDSSIWIEVEDFDYEGGKTLDVASTMPYAGGAYSNLLATLNVDYFDDQNDQNDAISYTYRGDRRPNHANLSWHTGTANLAQTRPAGFTATANFKLGWAGNFWGNYTRTIPAGIYRAYAALSHGDGTGTLMRAPLDKVTAGVGTTTQTLQRLGVFRGSGSTGWGNSVLLPLRSQDRDDAPLAGIRFDGNPVTLRFNAASGDVDWFVFVPATDVPPVVTAPSVSSPSVSLSQIPYMDLTVPADAVLTWRIEDFSTSVNPDTIKLILDGEDVSSDLTIEKQDLITTVTFDPPGLFEYARSYSYELTFKDTFTIPQTVRDTGTFSVNYLPNTPEGAFLIEAEDFNTGGGQYLPEVDTMPYLGGAYTNLAAIEGIDYQRTGPNTNADNYRKGEVENVPMGENNDANTYDQIRAVRDGGTWEIAANFTLGWAGQGIWMNYTRNIPANTYQIWAGMSSDRAAVTNGVIATLAKVTSSVTESNQVTELMGTFAGAGPRGWGRTILVPLRDGNRDIVAAPLAGLTTLRVNMDYGDVDYLMLIPTTGAAPLPQIDKISIAGTDIVLEWAGDATVQKTTSLPGTGGAAWEDVPGTSPLTLPISGQTEFYRLKGAAP